MTNDRFSLYPASFIDKIVVSDGGCWEWIASQDDRGYGQYSFQGRIQKAHRVSFKIAVGRIPEGLFVCHRCDNKQCVRPSHLFLGTQLDNIRDAISKGRIQRFRKDRCKRGHLFTNENSQWDNALKTERHCRMCANQCRRERRAKARRSQ